MKNYLIILTVFLCGSIYSQSEIRGQQPFTSVQLKMPENKDRCMTAEEIKMYNRESADALERQRVRMAAKGQEQQSPSVNRLNHQLMAWPMRLSGDYDMQYKYYYKGNFVDQYQDDTVIHLDYTCWSRTYNGHDASDISLWPFWWRMMDKNYVSAVAAAPGVIYFKQDGGYDRNCVWEDGVVSNRIYIRHFDGTTTRYHHLKNGSLTSKAEDDTVQTGEFLGYVGSSGRSTNPHLHFAVYDWLSNMIEPYYVNNCNLQNNETWWNNQLPYWDSKISRVMTHSSVPALGRCDADETVNAKNNFNPGDVFYTGVAFSENQNNDAAQCYIIRPDGNLFSTWFINIQFQEVNNYFINGFVLPSGNNGTWKIQVDYRGQSYYHFFTVGCTANLTPGGTQTGSNGYIAGNSINSTVNHNINPGDKVLYQAPGEIIFKPGFHAPAGVLLMTRHAGCNYAD